MLIRKPCMIRREELPFNASGKQNLKLPVLHEGEQLEDSPDESFVSVIGWSCPEKNSG